MTSDDYATIRHVLAAISESEHLHVQAQEQDGDHEYRLTVSDGGDQGNWFTMTLDFHEDAE